MFERGIYRKKFDWFFFVGVGVLSFCYKMIDYFGESDKKKLRNFILLINFVEIY